MRNYILISVLLLGSICILTVKSCKDPSEQVTATLAKVDLKRGELLLCGDGQFGEVNFTLGCNSETRATFNLAISLLHSFEYTEAEKAFVKVLDMDPDCPMAYWGVAMSNFHPLWAPPAKAELEKGSEILKIAKGLSATEQARDYLDAIGAFYEDWQTRDHRTRTKLFEEHMAALYEKYKDDKEAAVFYALSLNASADPSDKTYKNQRKAGALLESLFPDQPDHPGIAHYIIHNYDYPELAELALPTARRYASIAPASAHAQHMPSHIFTRLGLWEESIQSNLNSTASALCYSESIEKESHWDEEIHGMDYLVYAYLQLGDTEKAREQFDYLKSFKKIVPVNFKVAYTTAAIPARLALENRDWKAAAALELPLKEQIPWEEYPWEKSLVHFARAMGFIHLGNPDAAEKELSILDTNRNKLLSQQDAYKANQVHIQITMVRAWLSLSRGNTDQAVQLMKQAVDMETSTSKHPVTPGEVLPAGELLADMYLEMNRPAEALSAYEADMKFHPNRFNGIYGAAVAANKIGASQKALSYYQKLFENHTVARNLRKEFNDAREYLDKHSG